MRDLRLLRFQLKQFALTSYFVQVLFSVTLISVLMQWLLIYAGDATDDAAALVWIRAACVGAWAVACLSAGILGFQRFQGVLSWLISSPLGAWRTILPLIASLAGIGSLSFAIGALAGLVLGLPISIASPGGFVLGLIAYTLGCCAIGSVIALLFLLSPNAITYEPLLATPLVLITGVFGYPESLAPTLHIASLVVPTGSGVQLLLGSVHDGGVDAGLFLTSLLASLGWFVIASLALRFVLHRVRRTGTLEVL